MRDSIIVSRDLAAIETILSRIEYSKRFIKGLTKDDFFSNLMAVEASIRQIEIVGEAAKRISEETRKIFNEFPWKAAMGMRDIVIHQYDGVKPEVVWDTLTKDFPKDTHYLKQVKDFLDYEFILSSLWENTSTEDRSLLVKEKKSIVIRFREEEYLLHISEKNVLYAESCKSIENHLSSQPLFSGTNRVLIPEQLRDLSHGKSIIIDGRETKYDIVKKKLTMREQPKISEKLPNRIKIKR